MSVPTIIISSIIGVIILLLAAGNPSKLVKFMMKCGVRLIGGVFVLFIFNIAAALAGVHIPINLPTAAVIGFLGIPGLASLAAIHIILL